MRWPYNFLFNSPPYLYFASKRTPLKLELFIARKIIFNDRKSFSRFIVRVGVAAVALSVCAMMVASSMVSGFQQEISRKIFGFWGHIQIRNVLQDNAYEEVPMNIHQRFYPALDTMPGVTHVQAYGTKPGILKTKTDIEGIVFKGIGTDFQRSFLTSYLTEGRLFYPSDTGKGNDTLVLSKTTASRLQLKLYDKVTCAIIRGSTYRKQKMVLGGIYNTGLAEYDSKFAVIDLAKIQFFNNWGRDSVGGFEVFVHDVRKMDAVEQAINDRYYSVDYKASSIHHLGGFANIFEWLALQDVNKNVIIGLMVMVAIINMITALLILILDRTNMIGMLKAMGARSASIRRVFLLHAAYITGLGLLLGNFLGIGLCLLQKYFGLLRLPEESYYLQVAPVYFDWFFILAVNLGTLLLCTLVMIIPTYLITRISPLKAIRFS